MLEFREGADVELLKKYVLNSCETGVLNVSQNEKSNAKGQGLLVWMDLEMTGLDPEKDAIIEMATVITDGQLQIVAKGPELVIHQPPERFQLMDAWNQEHHKKSGLWDKVVASQINQEAAEQETMSFIAQHVDPRVSPLCGNSVYQDRRFLAKYMPRLESYLHYRLIDVSTIKELGQRWYGEQAKFSKSRGAHRAMEDILESIAELKNYRERLFVKSIV